MVLKSPFSVVLAALAFATWRHYSNWPAIWDIGLADETLYLSAGVARTFDFAAYEESPLYEAYYSFVGLLLSDPKDIYFSGGLALQLVTLCTIGFVAWRLSRSLTISTLVFGLALCSPFLMQWPRVAYFAAVFVIVGIWLASLETRLANRLAITTLVSLLLCFVRPEFVLTFYLAGGTLLTVLIIRTVPEVYEVGRAAVPDERRGLYRLAAYLSVIILVCVSWSFPLFRGNDRAMVAFGQHYALRWVNDHTSQVDPWLNYLAIINNMFPGAATPAQAVLANPAEWARFTILNLFGSFTAMRQVLLSRASIVFIVWLFVLYSIVAYAMRRQLRGVSVSKCFKALPLIECGLYAIAPLAAMVMIYPRLHYAVVLVSALACGFWALGRWYPWPKRLESIMALFAASIVMIASEPVPVTSLPNLGTINLLRTLNLPIHRMLDVDGGWCIYLKHPCTSIFLYDEPPATPLLQTMFDRKVDAIFVSLKLTKLLRDRGDRSLEELEKAEPDPEWRRYELDSGKYLLYREAREDR